MKPIIRYPLILASLGLLLLVSCREVNVTAVDVASVEVTPDDSSLIVGQSATFSVHIMDAQGRLLKRDAVWSSSDATIAGVDANGRVTANAPGSATIRATVGDKTGQAAIHVTSVAVATVEVTPAVVSLVVGDSVRLQAIARAADGSVLANRPATWVSSDNTVATILPDGSLRALSIGTAIITATVEGVRGQATINVRARLVTVASVEVQPATGSIGVGDTLRFQAIGRDAGGQVVAGPTPVWTSASPAVATVDGTGLAHAVSTGTAAITATIDGVSGQGSLTVTPPTISRVEVTPSSSTVTPGSTLQLTATVYRSDGSVAAGASITWTVDLPGVASVDQNGLVSGHSIGEATVTATAAGKSGTAKIFVVLQPVSTISITPANPIIFAGDSVLLGAILEDVNGVILTGRTVTWGVSDSSVASIVSTGAATQEAWLVGLLAGTIKVQASAEARTGETGATIEPGAALSIVKSASAALVKAGDTVQFAIRTRNAGPSPAANVAVTDTLPANATFIDATGGATLSSGVLSWPATASLAAGDSLLFNVRLRVGTTSLTNAAAATSTTSDPDLTDNHDAITVNVNPPDLVVTKTAPFARANAGEIIPFTITVQNNGTSAAGSVSVTDSLPLNATFVDATGNPLQSGTVLTWPLIGSLPIGGSVSYTVRVSAPPSGSVTNVARAVSPAGDANPADNRDDATVAVDALADLDVTKTASAAVVNAGETVSYTVRVRNLGPSAAAAIVVTDTLPANGTFVTGSAGSAVLSNNILTWPTIPSLAAGDSAIFTLSIIAPATGFIRNAAAAATSTAEASTANNTASATTTVNTADMTVAKTGPSTAAPGETVTYTIDVTNAGPGVATSVVVTDTLPAGLTFVAAPNGGTLSGNIVTWPTLQSLAAGGSVQYTISATVAAGTYTNVAAVTAATADPDLTSNRSTATTTASEADLSVAKTGPASVNAGQTITWSITVTNNSQTTSRDIVLQDTLPQGVTFVNATGGGVFANGVVTWTAASLAGGQTIPAVSVEAVAPAGAASLTNVARVSAATTDPVPSNDRSAIGTTVVPVANLGVTKTGPSEVDPNDPINYQIVVSNDGPSDAASVVVTDVLPAGVTFVAASGGGVYSNGSVTWQIPSLPAQGSIQLSVDVTAPATAGTIDNVVSVASSTLDDDATNDQATATTIVTQANLRISKSAPPSATVADPINYTITVTNAGPTGASGVTVHDTLPAGASVTAANPAPLPPAGGVLTWDLGSIANGASVPISVTLAPMPAGTIRNAADVASATNDPDLTDNYASATTTVTPAADLLTQMTASPSSPSAGDTVVYTITVTNGGPSDATDVVVTDVLPTNGTFVDATGGITPVAGALTFATVPTLAASATITDSVRVIAGAQGTMTNQAAATSAVPDPVTSNNTAAVVVPIATADLDVSMSGPTAVNGGSVIQYIVTLTNNGPGRALGATLSNTLPTNAALIDLDPAPNGPGSTAAVPQWLEPELESGEFRTYTIHVTAPLSGTVVNSASVLGSTLDPNPVNDNASVTTTVNPVPADLSIALAGPANVTNGQTMTYTIDVSNAGPGYGLDLVVSDVLPGKVSYVQNSATGPGVFSYDATTGTLTWEIPQQAPLAGALSFSFQVVVSGSGTITNTATVTALSPDPDTSNNTSTFQTKIN